MKTLVSFIFCFAAGAVACLAAPSALLFKNMDAPVVHDGRYHVLSCNGVFVVLDGQRGMSICLVGKRDLSGREFSVSTASIGESPLKATLRGDNGTILLDQSYDPAAHLTIIDQGPGRTAARVFFTLRSEAGIPYGSATLDLYIYDGRVFLLPSLFIDYRKGTAVVSDAGFSFGIPGKSAELIVEGSSIVASNGERTVPFGGDSDDFFVNVDNPGRASFRIGWLKNRYPAWMYMKHVGINPEKDELYEKWPLWITQRGSPLGWNITPHSGLVASYESGGARRLDFQWAKGDTLEIADGGYRAFNGMMAVFFGKNSAETAVQWNAHAHPAVPAMKNGVFKYYNEFEGVYEIDAQEGDVDCSFDNVKGTNTRACFVRVWNLAHRGGWDVKAANKPAVFGFVNDGDILEDPMVPILKDATGPARFALGEIPLPPGMKTSLTMKRIDGVQFVYQMYSALETLEAWSSAAKDTPLFRFHITKGDLYHAVMPGATEYAFFKLPLYWMKNGINQDTFMNHTQGFRLEKNGPDGIRFVYSATDLLSSGLSRYTVTVPYQREGLRFDIAAAFTAQDDFVRWSSLEYCDLYPFEDVYRRNFHYNDIVFLTEGGVFDRVGTGAWSGGFDSADYDNGTAYYGIPGKREGEGTKTPSPRDGSVWIVGDNAERGNILFRRGAWTPTMGSRSTFSLCNAWVDIHNTITGRQTTSPEEAIEYTVEVFRGPLPSLDQLNALYRKAAGGTVVKTLKKVNYSIDGQIEGFVME